MIRTALSILFAGLFATGATASDSPWPGLDAGPHSVGYRTIDVVDYRRTVAFPTDWRGEPRSDQNFRSVRVSVWYPALPARGQRPLPYRGYIEAVAFATLMGGEYLTGPEAYLAHSAFAGADPDRLRELLDRPTTAYRDATPLAGVFPTVVYAPSLGYEAFENSALFEYLASYGYIVAASRSAGPEGGEMSADLAGIRASREDLELILEVLHRTGGADLRRVGAMGFSWGGLSAALLGMRNQNVRAVVTLDGSLEHRDLPEIEERSELDPRRLRGGYLAIVGDRRPERSLADDALYADLVELRLPELRHWDFASDMIGISTWSSAEPEPERRALVDRTYALVARQVRRFLDAYLRSTTSETSHLVGASLPESTSEVPIETLVARAALPAPPTASEFADLLREDVRAARSVLARAERRDPEIELLDWASLQNVILTSPFATKLAILEMARENLGESSIYFNNLGQAWRLEGDLDKAVTYFRKALEHNPESDFARRAIAEIEAQ